MKRRTFLKAASGSLLLPQLAFARIPAHNWNSCDFGTGPTAKDRLYQGPFPQYVPEAFIPDSEVVMTTTASKEIVPNFGMGLTVYVSGDLLADAHGRGFGRRISRRLDQDSIRSEGLHSPQLVQHSKPAGQTRFPRSLETGFRDRQKIRETRGISRDAGKSRSSRPWNAEVFAREGAIRRA